MFCINLEADYHRSYKMSSITGVSSLTSEVWNPSLRDVTYQRSQLGNDNTRTRI